jgi:hypothetical protein
MIKRPRAIGIEINPKLVGVLLTEKMGGTLRLFCYYVSAEISQFDVPAEENEGNLQSLLASLNLEGTCTSLILDEVVQGRIYIQADNQYWLYTLLKSTVDTLPPMNADIGELPWLVIWRSQEAEVIQYGQIGDPEHCFALRSHVSETTAVRLMKHSKAFLNPVSVPRIKTYRRPYLKIAVAVLTAGALLVAALTCFFKVKNNSASQQEPSAQIMAPVSTNATCYLLFKHQISGPYPANVVEVMNGGGLLSPDTLWRADKSSDWVKLSELPKFPPIK